MWRCASIAPVPTVGIWAVGGYRPLVPLMSFRDTCPECEGEGQIRGFVCEECGSLLAECRCFDLKLAA